MLREGADPFWARMDATVAQDANGAPVCRAVMTDITERKRAEEEKEKLEAQFRHAQKAESLGRMAGGIAHHYNNLMGVVMGNLERSMYEQPPGS